MNHISNNLITLNQMSWCNPFQKPAQEYVDKPIRDEFIQQERWQTEVGRTLVFKGTSSISQALAMNKLQRERASLA